MITKKKFSDLNKKAAKPLKALEQMKPRKRGSD
jgi:hypothetical protein